jgi:hypothetical protein
MKMLLAMALVPFFFSLSSCSSSRVEKNGQVDATTDHEAQSARSISNESAETNNGASSPNPKDAVSFDGKNYIKKSGWLVPPRDHAFVDDTYDAARMAPVTRTRAGTIVKETAIHYIYKTPWIYSERFTYELADGPSFLRGKISSDNFLEMSVKGNVFMYRIHCQKVTGLPANSEPHEDPFMYQIQDRNGDGIFETLLASIDDIIVPNWVLKKRK